MPTQKNGYSGEELEKALYFIEDLFDRLNIPMYLHKSVARDVYEDKGKLEEADGVHVIVKKKEFNKFNRGMLRDLLKKEGLTMEETDTGFVIEREVPIYITVTEKDWKYLKNPDLKFYKVTEYLIPNPFRDYWKARGLIR